jgi:hypothetical protein
LWPTIPPTDGTLPQPAPDAANHRVGGCTDEAIDGEVAAPDRQFLIRPADIVPLSRGDLPGSQRQRNAQRVMTSVHR